MSEATSEFLRVRESPQLERATLVLALSGWMDGGDVSTGTVQRLVDLLAAPVVAEIDSEPFYLFNFPGSMEITALFRPHIKIEEGQVVSLDLPENTFHCHAAANLVLFIGKEPHLRWRTFGDAVLQMARRLSVRRIIFVGSFGGAVPHTREPRLYVTCSDPALLAEMEQYALKRTGYEGPGSFTSYLLTRAPAEGLEMVSLVAEIPGYLQGRNPMSIEAVTRRLAKILKLPLDLQSLRAESTEWELQVSRLVAKDKDMAKTVRQLEEAYDNELLENSEDETEGG